MILGGYVNRYRLTWIVLLSVCLSLASVATAFAAPTRVVVLPFYVEAGRDASDGGQAVEHYRRTMRAINNHLDRHNFEVINPFSKENIEREYDRVSERARMDSVLAIREVCEKYGVDMAYIVWLKVTVEMTPDGYYRAAAMLDGEGYDAAGHDLAVGVSESIKVTRRNRGTAVAEVEKWVGDIVGRTLTTWHGEQTATTVGEPSTVAATGQGVLAQNIEQYTNTVNIRLDGATRYEVSEVFGKILNTVTGMVEATRYGSSIVADNPQASYVAWRANIADTEPFRLEANIMNMINQVIDADGTLTLKGVPYRYSADEIVLLKGIHPSKSNAHQLQFVVDRNLMMQREMIEGGHNSRKGFE